MRCWSPLLESIQGPEAPAAGGPIVDTVELQLRRGRADGIHALDLLAAEPDRARAAAQARGLLDDDGDIRIAGTKLCLVDDAPKDSG